MPCDDTDTPFSLSQVCKKCNTAVSVQPLQPCTIACNEAAEVSGSQVMKGLVSQLREHGFSLEGSGGPRILNKEWHGLICADTNVQPIYVGEKY